MKSQTLYTDLLSSLSRQWDPTEETPEIVRDETSDIDAAKENALKHISDCADWYSRQKRKWRSAATLLRTSAILLVGATGVIPVLPLLGVDVNPVWTTATLALGVGAVAVDRFFGFSSRWIRFVHASLELSTIRSQLLLDLEMKKATSPDPLGQLTLIRQALEQVNNVVHQETAEWVAEFESQSSRNNKDD